MTTQYPVLVYGTLRPGHSNYRTFLEGTTVFEQKVEVDGFTMHSTGGFPYLIDGLGTVVADLVYLQEDRYDEVLNGLDFLEGFYETGDPSNHYDRRLLDFTVDGVAFKAWIYICNRAFASQVREGIPQIVSGDWAEYLGSTPR